MKKMKQLNIRKDLKDLLQMIFYQKEFTVTIKDIIAHPYFDSVKVPPFEDDVVLNHRQYKFLNGIVSNNLSVRREELKHVVHASHHKVTFSLDTEGGEVVEKRRKGQGNRIQYIKRRENDKKILYTVAV
jgi:hypothetical protein